MAYCNNRVCEGKQLLAPDTLEKPDLFHSREILFPEYFKNISWIFPQPGKLFHTMELDTSMEIGFSKFILKYFQTMEEVRFSHW